MKILLFISLLFVSVSAFAQSLSDFKAVSIPLKFDFISTNNQYRLCTLSKFNLNKAGFIAFYANEIPKEFNDRCDVLYYDIVKEKAFLATKFHIELKDCNGNLIYKSESGYTKEKDTELAYTAALNGAFTSVYNLNYKYKPVTPTAVVSKESVSVPITEIAPKGLETGSTLTGLLYAQPTSNGFQLIDSTPKVVMKLFKTDQPTVFIALKDNLQGVLIVKESGSIFEYYQNDKLVTEKIAVKF